MENTVKVLLASTVGACRDPPSPPSEHQLTGPIRSPPPPPANPHPQFFLWGENKCMKGIFLSNFLYINLRVPDPFSRSSNHSLGLSLLQCMQMVARVSKRMRVLAGVLCRREVKEVLNGSQG